MSAVIGSNPNPWHRTVVAPMKAAYAHARDNTESYLSNKWLLILTVFFGVLFFVAGLLAFSVVDKHFVVNSEASYTPDQVKKYDDDYKGMKIFGIATGSLMVVFAAWFFSRIGTDMSAQVRILRHGEQVSHHPMPMSNGLQAASSSS